MEKPYAMFFTCDFNAKSINWWPEGENSPEGIQLDNVFSDLNLS